MARNEREIYTVHIHTLHDLCRIGQGVCGELRTHTDFENFRQNDRNDVTLYIDTYQLKELPPKQIHVPPIPILYHQPYHHC